ncbi:MAG TPA: ABC transporter substrate-binding protein, partial [Firmicutes bacterium]|nr:ABC transporter substrate-binding protein [Bacillota bacterium]
MWSKIEAAGKLKDDPNFEPVGSGPYKLLSYSPEQIVVERDDNYWGIPYFGKPAPKYIVHPIFKSNDAGNLALERAEVDLSQQFCPEIWKMWENKKLPVGTWYKKSPYHIPASIPSLFINIHKHPLDLPQVRRALAYAIDYEKIAETAMSRYSPPAQSSLLIPVGVPEKKYFNADDVKKYGWEYNPQKAVEILEKELKAKKGPDGIYVLPDGTRLGPFIAECPYGWTDWMTSLEVVAASARKVGIEIRTQYPDAPVWTDHRNTGNFDLLMNTPAGGYSPAHPWVRFRDVMDIRGVPPVGQVAYWNYNRYSNPKVGELLDKAAATSDEKELTEIYRELNQIFMKDIPIIPLEYRPWEFYEFNETYWTGFPTDDNPTAPPQHNFAGVKILY